MMKGEILLFYYFIVSLWYSEVSQCIQSIVEKEFIHGENVSHYMLLKGKYHVGLMDNLKSIKMWKADKCSLTIMRHT